VGPGDAEQVVLCVHGLTRNAATSTSSRAASPQKGMRVIAPDLPGRGKSEWLKNGSDYARPPTSPRPRR
jgi:pimeloyl-ACP methyl ester carboxylesterase